MHQFLHRLKSVAIVEFPPDHILQEDLHFELTASRKGMVHKGSANSLAVKIWVHKQTAYLIPNERDETHDFPAEDINPCLSRREVLGSDRLSFAG